MPRIEGYDLEGTLNNSDKLVGTGADNETKNFTLEQLAAFLEANITVSADNLFTRTSGSAAISYGANQYFASAPSNFDWSLETNGRVATFRATASGTSVVLVSGNDYVTFGSFILPDIVADGRTAISCTLDQAFVNNFDVGTVMAARLVPLVDSTAVAFYLNLKSVVSTSLSSIVSVAGSFIVAE